MASSIALTPDQQINSASLTAANALPQPNIGSGLRILDQNTGLATLGPAFDQATPSLSSLLPINVHTGAQLLLNRPSQFNGSIPRSRSWPWLGSPSAIPSDWPKWVDRMSESYQQHWDDMHLSQLLRFSQSAHPPNATLTAALASLWCPNTNVLCLRGAPLSISMVDVCAITGLRPTGPPITPALGVDAIPSRYRVSREVRTYSAFIERHRKSDGVASVDEHVHFLTMWLCKYVFCSKSLQVTGGFYQPALALSN